VTLLTIGIPTYRGADRVAALLESLNRAIATPNIRVLVVDDGSPPEEQKATMEVAYKLGADFMGHEHNRGPIATFNTIASSSQSDYVCILDNDVVVPKWWLESLLVFLNNRFAVASWKSTKLGYGGRPVGSLRRPERATELAGYCYLFPKSLWEGYSFDEGYHCFIADSDFCVYWASKGIPSYRILWPLVYHAEHATYDSCPELEHVKWRERDLGHFYEKWGKMPREAERDILAKLPRQRVRWLTEEGPKEDCDS